MPDVFANITQVPTETIELILKKFDLVVAHPGIDLLQWSKAFDLVPEQVAPASPGAEISQNSDALGLDGVANLFLNFDEQWK